MADTEAYPASEDGERARRRHRIARALVEEPVLYVCELEPSEQDSYRSQRHRLEPELEALTGLQAERRSEGSALVAASGAEGRRLTDVRFPTRSTESLLALLACERLCVVAHDEGRNPLPASEVDALMASLRERLQLEAGAELDRAALALLEAHRLIEPVEPAQVRVLPGDRPLRPAHPASGIVSVTVLRPPRPRQSARYRLHRAGLIGLYEYEDETFEFERGRLLLRGANGSGKSKALELLLPLLLDGELRPERLDPFGGRGRSMRWNLVGDQESRAPATGFSWLELHRRDEHDVDHWATLVLMSRANKGETGVHSWFGLLQAERAARRRAAGPAHRHQRLAHRRPASDQPDRVRGAGRRADRVGFCL